MVYEFNSSKAGTPDIHNDIQGRSDNARTLKEGEQMKDSYTPGVEYLLPFQQPPPKSMCVL